jgi:hypothetical protein
MGGFFIKSKLPCHNLDFSLYQEELRLPQEIITENKPLQRQYWVRQVCCKEAKNYCGEKTVTDRAITRMRRTLQETCLNQRRLIPGYVYQCMKFCQLFAD